jgi:endonuclease/exonuclease/phosphatase family metal-dependent hydrolase
MKNGIVLLILLTLVSGTAIAKGKDSSRVGLNFATFNIRNFGSESSSNKTDKRKLKSILLKTGADVIGVQEIVDAASFKRFVKNYLPTYKVRLTKCGGLGDQKLGFIYKTSILTLSSFSEDQIMNEKGECAKGLRPAAVAKFRNKKNGVRFTAINVHLKAGGTQSNADKRYWQYGQLTKLIKKHRKFGAKYFVVVGDFNTTDYVLRNKNYRRFLDVVEKNNLIDFSESLECSSYWYGGVEDSYFTPSLLDHILVSESLWDKYKVQEVEVGSHCKKVRCDESHEDRLGATFKDVSDHCPVSATLK